MSWEQIFALGVGMAALPFIYWLGFDLSYKEGQKKAVRELAQLDLDGNPEFRLKIINEQLDIINERRTKKAYENE